MGLYSMRAGKDAVLFRLASAAYHLGFTPNTMTMLGLCFGVASGLLFMAHVVIAAFAFGFLSVFCDVLDGTLARKFHLETRFGLIFDSVSDRITEAAVVLGALIGGIIEPLGLVAIIGSITLFALRAASYRYGLKTDYVYFGRFERLICLLAGLIVPVAWVSTLCFVAAGGFGLVSSCQVAAYLQRHRR